MATPGHTSLELPAVAQGQPYGQAARQQAALRAVPLPQAPKTGPVGTPTAPNVQTVPLSAPTQNPNEPVTAGAPVGPGPGVEALGPAGAAQMGQPQDAVREQVAALYRVNPNPDLLRLMELLDLQGR